MTEPLNSVSKRFLTPIGDSLKESQRNFVLAYCQCFDVEMAAKKAGYKNQNPTAWKAQVRKLVHDPKIVAAIDEHLERRLEQLDAGRAALCTRLMSQSMAGIHDVCDRAEHISGRNGETLAGKWTYVPKAIEEVEERFLAACSLVILAPNGSYTWDNIAQHRASTLLAKLMMWDQTILEQSAPIIFNFGAIQDEPYVKPKGSADLSLFAKGDEIDDLTH